MHEICTTMRELRKAAGMSLQDAENVMGISAVALGSYERGERNPPLAKIEQILNTFGHRLAAVPMSDDALRLPADMAKQLRAMADQWDAKTTLLRRVDSIHGVENPDRVNG
jgi:transcriptional regulator with XRE-family HTH domain